MTEPVPNTDRAATPDGGPQEVAEDRLAAPGDGARQPETQAPADASGDAPESLERHAPTADELEAELDAARAKADETWDMLLRARAEMDNLKKRQAAELEKAHKFALDGFVRELLPVQDSLELGLAAAQADGADLAKVREGTELTLKLLTDALARFGVEPVSPEGQPFDPELHQAMTMQPRSDVPPNTVVAVMQKGWTLNGRLVRPALVMVSGAG